MEFGEAGEDEFSGRTHFTGLVDEFLVGVRNEGAFNRGFIDLDVLFLVIWCGTSFKVSWFVIDGDFASDCGCGHGEVESRNRVRVGSNIFGGEGNKVWKDTATSHASISEPGIRVEMCDC
jgi:hypothetical protein